MRATQRTHLLLAQLLWTTVGSVLFGLGCYWVFTRYGPSGALYLLPFAVLGFAKGLFVLDRVASKAVQRIRLRGDGRNVLGFFSLRMWAVAASMMLLGQALRYSELPRADLGFLYVTVGVGLVFGSHTIWAAWWQTRTALPVGCEAIPEAGATGGMALKPEDA